MDFIWHPWCFRCYACDQPIIGYAFCTHEDYPYDMSCYWNLFHPKCDVCMEFVPIDYRVLPIWMQKTCPSHEHDGTQFCFSCHRKEGYPPPEEAIAGCLSQMETVQTKFKRWKISILLVKGLPRILIGSHLAHEMMHAWLKLNDYGKLDYTVEEGICEVMAYMWIDFALMSSPSSNITSSSSSSFLTPYKKGQILQFERKLAEYNKYAMMTHKFHTHLDGLRAGLPVVRKYGLKFVLDHIKLTGSFPC